VQVVDLLLARARLSGKLVRSDGSAVASALVTVLNASNQSQNASVYTDSQGVYQFDALPPNVDLVITAKVGAERAINRNIRLNIDQDLTAFDLVMSGEFATVRGAIKGFYGNAITGIGVYANWVDNSGIEQYQLVYSNDLGLYQIDFLPLNILISVSLGGDLVESQAISLTSNGEMKQVDFIQTSMPSY
jgi:hypothetical protein